MKCRDDFPSSLPLKQNIFERPKKFSLALKSKDSRKSCGSSALWVNHSTNRTFSCRQYMMLQRKCKLLAQRDFFSFNHNRQIRGTGCVQRLYVYSPQKQLIFSFILLQLYTSSGTRINTNNKVIQESGTSLAQ